MSQGSDRIDYQETPDLTEVHAAIQREHRDPSVDVTPVPLWVSGLCAVAICWAGVYVGMFHGGFSSSVYNEFESSPAVLFPLPARSTGTTTAAPVEDLVSMGKQVYQGNCQSCHQPNGLGQAGAIPPLAGSEWVVGDQKRLAMILIKGLMGSVTVKGATFNGVMPPWEASLSDKKIAAVTSYIRQEWGNKAEKLTPEFVAKVRKEVKPHAASWSEAELLQVTSEGGEAKADEGKAPEAVPAAAVPVVSPSPAAAVAGVAGPEDGKANYMTTCVACHQPTGTGLPTVFPSLVKSEYVGGVPDRLTAMVLKGITPPFEFNGVVYTQMMIPQEAILNDAKIASILTFVRSSFENSAPAVTPEFVSEVRKKFSERKTPWTEAELKNWPSAAPAQP